MKLNIKQLKQIINEEVSKASQLDERSAGLDKLMAAIRNNVNTCSQTMEDTLRFVKSKRPDWQEAIVALEDCVNALEDAHSAILEKSKG